MSPRREDTAPGSIPLKPSEYAEYAETVEDVSEDKLFSVPDDVKVGNPADDLSKRDSKRYKQLVQFYGMIGMLVHPVDPFCASAILTQAEDMARSMDQLAAENPAVRKVLDKLFAVNAYGVVISAHLPVLMTIATHHVPRLREQFAQQVATMAGVDPSQNGHPQ